MDHANRTRSTALGLAGLAALLYPASALAQPPAGAPGWGWGNMPYMMGYGMGWLGTIMMLVVWGMVVVGGVYLVRWLIQSVRHASPEAGGRDRALEILRERYARGEIDKEQYERMRADLQA